MFWGYFFLFYSKLSICIEKISSLLTLQELVLWALGHRVGRGREKSIGYVLAHRRKCEVYKILCFWFQAVKSIDLEELKMTWFKKLMHKKSFLIKLVMPIWRARWQYLWKSKVDLPFGPIIPFLGVKKKEIAEVYLGIDSEIFIEILSTVVKNRKNCWLLKCWLVMKYF